MHNPTRREMLSTATAASVAAVLPKGYSESSSEACAQATSPNERFKVALIGCGGMGTFDAKFAERFADVVAICDVDQSRLDAARQHFKGAKTFNDYRHVCDLSNLDVVINGTPDH